MQVEELQQRLGPFVQKHVSADALVTHAEPGPGHAGFSYFFDVLAGGETKRYFLRLPPPDVKWEGTADVLRQVAALNALEGTAVPRARVLWSGDDLQWFGCPYFIQPRLNGDTMREAARMDIYSPAQRKHMARQAMTALAGIHKVDGQAKAPYLGEFWGFEFDVTRWDRFYERAAEQELLALQPRVRELLLANIPSDTRISLYHGDFQWSNLLYSDDAELLAVVDWELTGIGAVLNDLGWIGLFNEPRAWAHDGSTRGLMGTADELEALYTEAWGSNPGNVRWFKALAGYKFSIISGFNLMLHRRGKRHDPHWEDIKPSMRANMEFAMEMLSD